MACKSKATVSLSFANGIPVPPSFTFAKRTAKVRSWFGHSDRPVWRHQLRHSDERAARANECCVSNSRACISPVCPHRDPLDRAQRMAEFGKFHAAYYWLLGRRNLVGIEIAARSEGTQSSAWRVG